MRYLLDSDIVIYHLNGVVQAINLLDQLAGDGMAMSAVTYMEVLQGPGSRTAEQQERLSVLLNLVPVLPMTEAEALRCADIRLALAAEGKRVRSRALDLIVAATALEHNLTMVTNNVSDYADIPGLLVLQMPVM